MSVPAVWVCCGVLRAEVEELARLGKISGELLFLDSMLHMDPPKLEAKIEAILERLDPKRAEVAVIYGDCCPGMLNLVRQYRVGRVDAINCAQMLVGHARYRELMRQNSFMLLPEWTLRWKEVFQIELGLPKEVARDLMAENRGELVYLDTGLAPVPREALAECADYTGLPWRVETVTLEPLLAMLLSAQASVTVQHRRKVSS